MMTGYVQGLDVLSMLVLHFVRVWQRACGERLRPCKYDGYELTLTHLINMRFRQPLSPALPLHSPTLACTLGPEP